MKYILISISIIMMILFSGQISIAQVGFSRDPFKSGVKFTAKNELDRIVLKNLKNNGFEPADICSDQVFVRRVYLDITGTLPAPRDIWGFIRDRNKSKRAKLIDKLLDDDNYADYWALKWSDLLRVKAEFPINLWPNGVQAYYRWIHDAVKNNMPYDQFVRELLTSSGSNFRVPQVNFYRAIQGRKPESIASAVALTFMGVRYDKLTKKEQADMAKFFSKLKYKSTAEWKEVIVITDQVKETKINAVFPDGKEVLIGAVEDPRKVFADWLIDSKNPWFTKNISNRIWSWLFGYGIIHEPDDIRDDNKPVNPELLAYLQKELVKNRYDIKSIFRLILNSSTYQQSSVAKGDSEKLERHFACYPVRRLEAEVISDNLTSIFGLKPKYSSAIPEPFTFVPEEYRSVTLSDGSITSEFLEMFGRSPRDTGLESERSNKTTPAQRMYMLNSSHIYNMIAKSWKLKEMLKNSKKKEQQAVQVIYTNILSRPATAKELQVIKQYLDKHKLGVRNTIVDLIWALINSKEFLYRH